MECPFCKSEGKVSGTGVVNSRKTKDNDEVWRRRHCLECGEIFTTIERISYNSFFVVKRNLSRKRFTYEKLFSSVLNAIAAGKGRDQGDDAMKAKRIASDIIAKLFTLRSMYISSKDIIRATHHVLEKEDSFFALRYATYSQHRIKTLKTQ